MKITEVQTHILRAPVDVPFTSARGWWYRTKNALLVRVRTDDGVDGWGEAYGPPEVARAVVDHLLAPLALGHDPEATDVLWRAMYQRVEDYDPQGFAVAALGAVDMALWDIRGKVAGRPVYDLLGGAHRTQLRPYATGLYFTSEYDDQIGPAVEEATSYREQGFTGVKMKIALPPREELARVERVRGALGPDVELMVDANHGYDRITALRLGREFDRMGLTWFEEPLPPHDLSGYRDMRSQLETPLAGGENAFTRHAFARILEEKAMDIVQPDVCCVGGITEFARIAVLAEAAGVSVVPHVWGSTVGMHAALQVMAALPPMPQTWRPRPLWMEYEQTQNPFRDELATRPVRAVDGQVQIPDSPGLGVEIDENVVDRYRVG